MRLVGVEQQPRGSAGHVRGGAGISILPDHIVNADLASGQLVRLIGAWTVPPGGIYAIYPPSARVAQRKARLFVEYLKAGPFAPVR